MRVNDIRVQTKTSLLPKLYRFSIILQQARVWTGHEFMIQSSRFKWLLHIKPTPMKDSNSFSKTHVLWIYVFIVYTLEPVWEIILWNNSSSFWDCVSAGGERAKWALLKCCILLEDLTFQCGQKYYISRRKIDLGASFISDFKGLPDGTYATTALLLLVSWFESGISKKLKTEPGLRSHKS